MVLMFNISLEHYLFLGAILFTIGVLGIFLNKKNLIVILMSIELILLSVNINFIAFSSYMGELSGQVFAMLTLTVAAAEAANIFSCEVLHRGGCFVGKVFQGGTEEALLNELKKKFKSVKHAKPAASRTESSEIYVVAQGYYGANGNH